MVCEFCCCSCSTCDQLDGRLSASSENLHQAAVVTFPTLRPPRSGGAAGKTVLHISIRNSVCKQKNKYFYSVCTTGIYIYTCMCVGVSIYVYIYISISIFI